MIDFDKTMIKHIDDDLRCPVGRIPDPNPGAATGAKIPMTSFVFWDKSHKRLVVSVKLLRYYEKVYRPTSTKNFQ